MRPKTGIAAFVTALSAAAVVTAATTANASTSAPRHRDRERQLNAAAPAAREKFTTVVAPKDAQVVRGVTFAPRTR
jgi:hypothetical protein